MSSKSTEISAPSAMKFVVLMGVVSLFADVTYEGARSISGPFLGSLGATAMVVGFVAGLGELLGYALRFFSGYVSDKTQNYWAVTIIGYVINLLAVPALAFAPNWLVAAILLVLERVGKAIRNPARDAMLSHATAQMGRGFGFGLHEAMDQIGAVSGPLLISLTLWLKLGYRNGFAALLAPALLALATLMVSRFLYPRPHDLEPKGPVIQRDQLPKDFWIYVLGVWFIGAGYADFALVAYHLGKTEHMAADMIPLLYALAMFVDAVSSLVSGKLFDQKGMIVVITLAILSACFAPLVFLGSGWLVVAGMVLWGIGMGAQESIMRAQIGNMVPSEKRGSAFGIFGLGFGIFWFAGSATMGLLYGLSTTWLVIFSVACQLAAVPLLLIASRQPRAK